MVGYSKIQKDFALFVSISKTQKYLLFFFGFVKFVAEVHGAWLSFNIIQATQVKGNSDDL